MMLPRSAAFIVRSFAPEESAVVLLGDLEEVHRARLAERGALIAWVLTNLEAAEIVVKSRFEQLRHADRSPASWVDFKLGGRMLLRYPGLTVVGGLAMALGIGVGASCFEFYSQVLHPRLPFDEGDRVVDVALFDDRSQRNEARLLHEFVEWRENLRTLEDLGVAQDITPNLVTGDGRGEPVLAAAVTASTFALTRVSPLLGRTLVAADESAAAPDVVVIGYDLWTSRFASDPDIVERVVTVGGIERTVVGVMPSGFGFPIRHSLWIPLRLEVGALQPLRGPEVGISGRLVAGATVDEARAEVDEWLARSRTERPDVYEHLHGEVLPFAEAAIPVRSVGDRMGMLSLNVFAGLFLILVCGNVALLMFARAAAREGEIVVRTALGASRARIVRQLFAEALVLGALAAVLGLSAAAYGLEWLVGALVGGTASLAFWQHASLSPTTVAYASLLTVAGAAIAGVVPALRITSGQVETRLRRVTAGGGGLRFGGIWTAVVVVQVAATLTFPAVGWFVQREARYVADYQPPFPSGEYVASEVRLNAGSSWTVSDTTERSEYLERYARSVRALTERLDSDASVRGATFTRDQPTRYHPWRRIELDGGGEAPRNELDLQGVGRRVRGGVVVPGYFEVLGAEATQGRTFDRRDADPEARTVVVTQPFVDEVLGGRNPIGRRLRYLESADGWDGIARGDEPGPWYRIVGVVPDLIAGGSLPGAPRAGLYHAVALGAPETSTLIVHAASDATGLAPRLRDVAREVEPDLALILLGTLDQVRASDLRTYAYWLAVIAVVSGITMLLSLAGIYAVMSFTVSRRVREIGVRVALGGSSARIATAIFRGPLLQIGAGLVGGLCISVILGWGIVPTDLWGRPLLGLLGYGTLMTAICSLACIVPLRRALSVEPTEALAAGG